MRDRDELSNFYPSIRKTQGDVSMSPQHSLAEAIGAGGQGESSRFVMPALPTLLPAAPCSFLASVF